MRSAKDPPEESPEQVGDKIAAPEPRTPVAGTKALNRDMGSALRSIYQRTVEEEVPDEMLSLLGKLD